MVQPRGTSGDPFAALRRRLLLLKERGRVGRVWESWVIELRAINSRGITAAAYQSQEDLVGSSTVGDAAVRTCTEILVSNHGLFKKRGLSVP